MRRFIESAVCVTALAIIPSFGAGAAAQVSAQGETAAVGVTSDDIIVTARRRDERLQDVPVALTAFSTEDLTRYSTSSLAQVATQTPGLILGQTANLTGGVVNLRGVGSADGSPGIDQAVSIAIDGIMFSSATFLRLGLYDLERIEVLKGPQALFYGKNSPGGVISIVSANPGDRMEAKVRLGYEFYDEKKFVEAVISTPLTDSIGVRVDGYFQRQNGWLRNTAEPFAAIVQPNGTVVGPGPGASQKTGPDNENYFVRGTLAFASPNGFLDANLKVSYGQQNDNNSIASRVQNTNCAGPGPQLALQTGVPGAGNLDCRLDRYYNEPDVGPQIRALHPLLDKQRRFDNSHQFLTSLNANLHLSDDLTLTSVTGYAKSRETTISNYAYYGLSAVESYLRLRMQQFSQELRLLTSFDGPFNILLGGYYQKAKYSSRSVIAFDEPYTSLFTGGFFTGPIVLANNLQSQKAKAWSVFGQVIIDITPELELTAGGRYSRERKSVFATTFPDAFVGNSTFDPLFLPDSKSFNDFSPDITLTYKPISTLTLYGAFREGFKSGGFDMSSTTTGFGASTISNITYEQETARGFEVGAKGRLADNQITYSLALYRYKYKGLQVSTFDPRTLGYQLTNAATATVKGVELETEFRPRAVAGLSLRGSVAYNSAKFGTFENGPCYTGQSPALGCAFVASRDASGNLVVAPIGPGQVGNVQDLSGKTLYRAPRWSGNIGATYETEIVPGIIVSGAADGIYADSFFGALNRDPASFTKSAWRLNARLAVRADNDRWELALIGTNLTNVLRNSNSFTVVGSGGGTGTPGAFIGDTAGTLAPWRTITLQATLKY